MQKSSLRRFLPHIQLVYKNWLGAIPNNTYLHISQRSMFLDKVLKCTNPLRCLKTTSFVSLRVANTDGQEGILVNILSYFKLIFFSFFSGMNLRDCYNFFIFFNRQREETGRKMQAYSHLCKSSH